MSARLKLGAEQHEGDYCEVKQRGQHLEICDTSVVGGLVALKRGVCTLVVSFGQVELPQCDFVHLFPSKIIE